MHTVTRFLRHATLALAVMAPSVGWAQSGWNGPPVFDRDAASTIGQARQHYDRAQYERYRGNPGAQFELRQKRQNLCRNVPEMC